MKKPAILLLCLFCLLLPLAMLPAVPAQAEAQSAGLTEGTELPLSIDGVPRNFLPGACFSGSTIMIPLRPVLESLGGQLSWDSADASISCRLEESEIKLQLDSPVLEASGRQTRMPASASLKGGVVLAPARATLEALGASVAWLDGGLAIYSPGFPPDSAMDAATISPPGFYISDSRSVQGQLLMMWLTPCQPGDQLDFSCALPGGRDSFYSCGDSLFKMIGIPGNAPAGYYSYHARLERQGVRLVDFSGTVQVLEGGFDVQRLWVDSSLAAMRDPELSARDGLLIDQALSDTAASPLWRDSFIQPCEGRITTGYGVYRSVNGGEPYQHSGLDIAADYGVPVKAANSGVALMADSLYVTGNTVILDHGCGVYSMYYHLQDMYVIPGEAVERGQAIGTVGSTGFSTGPHLHWNMGVDGNNLNPYTFLGSDFLTSLTGSGES